MAKVKIRTPEDLDKVFEDIFRILYDMNYKISNIEAEMYKKRPPTITTGISTNPFLPSAVVYGPGSKKYIDDDVDMTKEIQDIIKAFKNDKKTRE